MNLNYQQIKALMGMPYDYADDVIIPIIDTVALYLQGAGVDESVIESKYAYGCIATGTKDLYNFNSGSIKFSPVFDLMMVQLAGMKAENVVEV